MTRIKNMTKNPVRDGKDETTIVPASTPLPLLAADEPRAQIEILSLAKRSALVACFNANELHKKDGAWHGSSDGKPVSGMTVADLARDGMLTVTTNYRLGSARLTKRGSWFARTLLYDGAAAERATQN
jgi:hypothetical protein